MDTPVIDTPQDVPPVAVAEKTAKPGKSKAARLKAQAEKSRVVRDALAQGAWKQNVEYRRGKPFQTDSDQSRVAVPVDWSMTKSKEAGLFSQVPQVILTPKHDRYKPAVPVMQNELNTVLKEQVKADVMMEEALADVINAAGLAGVITGLTATFEERQALDRDIKLYPGHTPETLVAAGLGKMVPVQAMLDRKFFGKRLSPSQLLWPTGFHGSDFDDADWVGYDDSSTWADALRAFKKDKDRPNGLTPEMKDKVCGSSEKPESLSPDDDEDADDEMVSFTVLFYWAARQDPDETKLEKIRTLVFVNGIEEPVIDEDFRGQKWSEETKSFIGLTKFPLRMFTLTYISDMPVPPSDSEVGRPQVDEMMRSRSQIMLQRDRSAPLRWANSNRVDPMVMQNIAKGDYQQIIPVNGRGDEAIGEVARANYPQEDWEFDRVIKQDHAEAWQVGPNQTGSFNTAGRTAAEANIVQSGFATRQAKERGKVAKFFCSIAEAVCGWMQLFHDGPQEECLVGPDGVQRLGVWNREAVSGAKCVFSIREDSTVKLDSAQQLDKVSKFLNLAGKSGFVNVKSLVEQMALLSGLDPATIVVDPNPKQPEPPNVSLRAGGEDLSNPVVGPYLVALMQKGHPVTPQDIEAAVQLLIKSSTAPLPPDPNAPPVPPPGVAPAAPPQAPGAPVAQPPKDFGPMERVTKRINEPGG